MFSPTPLGIHASKKKEKATQGSCGLQLNSAGAEDSARGMGQKVWNSRGCRGKSLGLAANSGQMRPKLHTAEQQTPKVVSTRAAWKLLNQKWIAVKSSWWGELRCYLGPCARQHWIDTFIELVVPEQGLCKEWQDTVFGGKVPRAT